MDKVSVVIPFYNHWNLVHQTLFDLYTYNRDSVNEIVLVDDCSTDDDVYGGVKWWRGMYGMDNGSTKINYIQADKNEGFLKTANLGMYSAKGDILILLSNDVLCKCKFVDDIVRVLKVPNTIVGGRLLDYDTGWNKFYDIIYPYLEGWLIGCTSKAWNELQGFDTRFAPCDFEDVDFSTKALSHGYSLTPLNSPKITHLGAQSIGYNPEREAGTKANKAKFEGKWIKGISH